MMAPSMQKWAAHRNLWATPKATDADRGGRGDLLQQARGNQSPSGHFRSWPTPTTQDASNDGGPSQFDRNSLPLNAAVKAWATPTAHPRTHTPRKVHHGEQLANQVGGSLNPTWVELLMGFPPGWTALS